MALTMLDKQAESSQRSAWPREIAAEFERAHELKKDKPPKAIPPTRQGTGKRKP